MLFITDFQENSVENNHRVVYAMHAKTAAGWINSAKICVYTVAAIAAGSVNNSPYPPSGFHP
ncbi:hypothetical protein H6G64_29780 [Calothrix sp. FACHB-156]|nr:hypothetical protein [Calothrix sp. FACHB-156]